MPAERRLALGDMPWRATLPLAAALFVGLGALWGVRHVARPIGFLVLAVALAEALAPPVARLEKVVPRGAATACVFALLAAALAGVGWLVVPPLVTQGQELVVRAPELGAVARRYLEQGNAAFGLQVDALLASLTRQVGGFLLTFPLRAFAAFVNGVLLLFLSAYWLVGAPALERFALTLVPPSRHAAAARVLGEMGRPWAATCAARPSTPR